MDVQSLQSLVESVAIIVENLPRSQVNLIEAMKVALLRDLALVDGQEQAFTTKHFSVAQLRRPETVTSTEGPLFEMDVTSNENVASIAVPRDAFFAEMSDIVLQAFLFEDKLVDFSGYNPLIFDIEMFEASKTRTGKTKVSPVKVADLSSEIHVKLPTMGDRPLTCAFYNEDDSDWEALKCDSELPVSEDSITCCTRHLTRFALVPAEYLEIVNTIQKTEEKVIEREEVAQEVKEAPKGLNVKYLVGSICAVLTLAATLFCLGKQILALKTEKRRYEQLLKDNNDNEPSDNNDPVAPTERALMSKDEDKPAGNSPSKQVATDQPALQNLETHEEEDNSPPSSEIKKNPSSDVLKFESESPNNDFLHIQDQD